MKYFLSFFSLFFFPIVGLANNDVFTPIDNSEVYFTKENQVFYYSGFNNEKILIPEADPATFQPWKGGCWGTDADNQIATDKNYFYSREQAMKNIDKNSLEIFDEYFLKDKNNVFFYYEIVPGIEDVKTFQPVSTKFCVKGEPPFWKDSKNVYIYRYDFQIRQYILEPIKNIDPKTFTLLYEEGCPTISKDKNSIYKTLCYNEDQGTTIPIETADLETFEYLPFFGVGGFSIYKDKYGYFFDADRILNLSPTETKINGIIFDKETLYILGKEIDIPFDYDTLEIATEWMDGILLKDKNHYYHDGKIVQSLNIATTTKITGDNDIDLFIDNNSFYINGKKGNLPKTFNKKSFVLNAATIAPFCGYELIGHDDKNMYFFINPETSINNYIFMNPGVSSCLNLSSDGKKFYKNAITITSSVDAKTLKAIKTSNAWSRWGNGYYIDKNNLYKKDISTLDGDIFKKIDISGSGVDLASLQYDANVGDFYDKYMKSYEIVNRKLQKK